MTLHYKTARIALAAGALPLSACANLAQVAPGAAGRRAGPVRPAQLRMPAGQRRPACHLDPAAHGPVRLGRQCGTDGKVDRVLPLLTDPHFKVLETGTWGPERALREFGPPARIDEAGLGESAKWSGPIATRKTASGIR